VITLDKYRSVMSWYGKGIMASLGENLPRLFNYSGMVNEKAPRTCVHLISKMIRGKKSVCSAAYG